jgi:hypothetical protein
LVSVGDAIEGRGSIGGARISPVRSERLARLHPPFQPPPLQAKKSPPCAPFLQVREDMKRRVRALEHYVTCDVSCAPDHGTDAEAWNQVSEQASLNVGKAEITQQDETLDVLAFHQGLFL